jgi:hypothetical protein
VLSGVDLERFHQAINRVRPTLIRVDADEATYSLHVILRFELEQELLSGSLSTADLPDAWNAKLKEYLGIDVPDDRLGVLQDVHWAGGSFGYFPTYALGNVVGLQIWERIRSDLPDLDDSSPAANSSRCTPGCATTSTATAASSRPSSCSSAWSAAAWTPAVRALPARQVRRLRSGLDSGACAAVSASA